jgi:hypothetical protein
MDFGDLNHRRRSSCCAHAVSGHAGALPGSAKNSWRFIASSIQVIKTGKDVERNWWQVRQCAPQKS